MLKSDDKSTEFVNMNMEFTGKLQKTQQRTGSEVSEITASSSTTAGLGINMPSEKISNTERISSRIRKRENISNSGQSSHNSNGRPESSASCISRIPIPYCSNEKSNWSKKSTVLFSSQNTAQQMKKLESVKTETTGIFWATPIVVADENLSDSF